MKKETFDNLNNFFENFKNNESYSKILDIFENNYFSTNFNIKIDEVLSKSSIENLIMHYINYINISESFLSMSLDNTINSTNLDLEFEENLSQNKIKLLFLLIYKELYFFSVKIEDFLKIDSKNFSVDKSIDDILLIKINNNENEIYKINNDNILRLKDNILSYYFSKNKINSFVKFINKFYI